MDENYIIITLFWKDWLKPSQKQSGGILGYTSSLQSVWLWKVEKPSQDRLKGLSINHWLWSWWDEIKKTSSALQQENQINNYK